MTDAFGPRKPPRIADAEGTMHEAPVVYALVHALDRGLTGQLVLTRPDGDSHTITFFEGAPVRVEPGVEGERVGEDLVASGHVSEQALAAALAVARTSRKRLGEILVEAGSVTPEDLTHALALQTSKRLGDLANLPPESTFSLYLSARAEPEPFSPWTPLDALLSAVRAWEDRQRLHGTLRWLADKTLVLQREVDLESLLLTSNEREALRVMQSEAATLKGLYASVGKGLSSLLYMLAVTRQFDFASVKGDPMGQPKARELTPLVSAPPAQVASVVPPPPSAPRPRAETPAQPAPVRAQPAPVYASQPPVVYEPPPPAPPSRPVTPKPFNPFASMDLSSVVSPHAIPRDTTPAPAPQLPPPPVPLPPMPEPIRRLISVPNAQGVAAPPARVSTVPAATGSVPPAARSVPPAAPAHPTMPSPAPVVAGPAGYGPEPVGEMSAEFHFAEEAVKQHDFVTAERILVERCNEADVADPRYEALKAWVKGNLDYDQMARAANDLSLLLMAQPECESALYYRGMFHKRLDKDKLALRDFVMVVKMNPTHVGALAEIKLLRAKR